MSTLNSTQNYGPVWRMFVFANNIAPVSGSQCEYMFRTNGKVPFSLASKVPEQEAMYSSPGKSLFIAHGKLPSRNYQSYPTFAFDIGANIIFSLALPVDVKPAPFSSIGPIKHYFINRGKIPARDTRSYPLYYFNTYGKTLFTLKNADSYRIIRADHYNQIQSRVRAVLGDGEGDIGYGQSVASEQVQIGQLITDTQWKALRSDLVKVRQHQTGNVVGSSTEVDNLNLITTEPKQVIPMLLKYQYAVFAETVVSERFRVGNVVSSNVSALNITKWSQNTSATVTLTQRNTTNKLRHFFNASGSVTFNFEEAITAQGLQRSYFFNADGEALTDTYNHVSRFFKNDANDISTPSALSWNSIFKEIGPIVFNYSSVVTSIGESMSGFYNTPPVEQLIYARIVDSKAVYIYAARNDAVNQLVFRFELRNDNAIDVNNGVSVLITQQLSSNTDVVVQHLTAI